MTSFGGMGGKRTCGIAAVRPQHLAEAAIHRIDLEGLSTAEIDLTMAFIVSRQTNFELLLHHKVNPG